MEPGVGHIEKMLANWRNGRASIEEVRDLAAAIGNRHFSAGTDALRTLLNHSDAIVRYNCIWSLGIDLKAKEVAPKLLMILSDDDDADCRAMSAAALGSLFEASREPITLLALAHAASADLDLDVQRSAYKALLIVSGVSREEHLALLKNEEVAVDHERVRQIVRSIKPS
jgi:hypothetical protein